MKREKCALCGRYYPTPGTDAAADECHGRSCWTDALNRVAERDRLTPTADKEDPDDRR